MQMFLSASTVTYDGMTNEVQHMEYEPRLNDAGQPNFGWMPTHQHTIRSRGQSCTRCHLNADGSNQAQVRATYGFGANVTVPLFTDDTGTPYDLSRMLADDGTPISEFAHADTGPVPEDVRNRAMAVDLPD